MTRARTFSATESSLHFRAGPTRLTPPSCPGSRGRGQLLERYQTIAIRLISNCYWLVFDFDISCSFSLLRLLSYIISETIFVISTYTKIVLWCWIDGLFKDEYPDKITHFYFAYSIKQYLWRNLFLEAITQTIGDPCVANHARPGSFTNPKRTLASTSTSRIIRPFPKWNKKKNIFNNHCPEHEPKTTLCSSHEEASC